MLKKFLRRCHNAVSRDTAQQTLAARFSLFLSPLLQNWAYIPFTNWAPGPEFLCHIANEICIRQRRTIVEFGSGVSTILMARLAKINALDVQIYSIDQNQDWQDRVAAICAADKTLGPVHFLCRPARLEDGKHDDAPVDMVIVDGRRRRQPKVARRRWILSPPIWGLLSPSFCTIPTGPRNKPSLTAGRKRSPARTSSRRIAMPSS